MNSLKTGITQGDLRAMAIAQISSRTSQRVVVSNIGVQRQLIYHLGMRPARRVIFVLVDLQEG
ncbi:MAG: DUF4372 domain-containing protein [Desulforhopalus sp.]